MVLDYHNASIAAEQASLTDSETVNISVLVIYYKVGLLRPFYIAIAQISYSEMLH